MSWLLPRFEMTTTQMDFHNGKSMESVVLQRNVFRENEKIGERAHGEPLNVRIQPNGLLKRQQEEATL